MTVSFENETIQLKNQFESQIRGMQHGLTN